MDYLIDFDPTHRVLRTTVRTALTDESLMEIYQAVARLASHGGPYNATILDLSQVVDFPVSHDTIRALAEMDPAVPGEGPRVVVAPRPALYGLCRMFELYRDSMGGNLVTVVSSIDKAYEFLNVSPADFSQRLFPESMAA